MCVYLCDIKAYTWWSLKCLFVAAVLKLLE